MLPGMVRRKVRSSPASAARRAAQAMLVAEGAGARPGLRSLAPLLAGGTLAKLIAVGLLFYFCQYSVIIFFNCALVAAAMIRLDGGDPRLGRAHLMGDVQAEGDHVAARSEHHRRRVRVGPDVELGGCGDIAAFRPRPAHDDHRPQSLGQPPITPHRQRQIGHRPQDGHGHRPFGPAHDQVHDGVGRRPVADDARRLERLQVAQSLGPVKGARPRRRPFQRPFRPAEHRRVLAPGDLAYDQRIALGQAAGDVARDRGYGQHLQLGRGEGQEQRHGVVHAGVAIDDQGLGRHHP